MSNKFLLAAAAGALLLTATNLAAAATTHKVHTQSGTTAKASTKAAPTKAASMKMTPAKTAPTKAASGTAPTMGVHHHKMARTEHRKKTAENVSIQGHREVQALNALEAAGYRRFNNLHTSGTNFVGTAMKSGKSYDVTVTQTGRIEATKA